LLLRRIIVERPEGLRDENRLLLRLLQQGIFGNGVEGLLNVERLLSTRLEVGNVVLGGTPLFCLVRCHLPTLRHVRLVAQHYEWEGLLVTWGGMHEKLVHPALKVIERLRVRDVINKHARVRTTVEGDTETLKALLASGVPDLQSDKFIINHDLLCEKVCSDCCFVLIAKALVHILIHQGSFANSAITEYDNLEQNLLAVAHDEGGREADSCRGGGGGDEIANKEKK